MWIFPLFLLLLARAGSAAPRAPITLYITSEVHNATEPCGCTSDPLGDVARLAHLLRTAPGGALLLDAGGLRFDSKPLPAEKQPEARLKARFLTELWGRWGAVVSLQSEDLAQGVKEGAAALAGQVRVVANLQLPGQAPGLKLVPTVLREVGGVKVGVLGLAAAEPAEGERPWPSGVRVSDALVAARRGEAALRTEGAQVVVALTGLTRPQARRLAQAVPGLDLVVAGERVEDGVEVPERVEGGGVLLVPAQQAQRVFQVEVHPGETPGRFAFFVGAAGQRREAERLTRQVEQVGFQLKQLERDRTADPAFVRTTRQELQRLQQELARAQRPVASPTGAYLQAELVPLRRQLPRDAEVQKAMEALDRQIGEENLKRIKGPPPPPPPGVAGYVGNAACEGACHESTEHWRGTRHAAAWKTLVDGGKQRSYDCVGCHATGFEEPGGSNLRTLAGPAKVDLRGVGCEVCHGPGSLHAKSPAKAAVLRPKPTEQVCLGCHTKEHSDTFEFKAYLRDVLGPGHGEATRAALGAGPTGHELRQAALKKAGR